MNARDEILEVLARTRRRLLTVRVVERALLTGSITTAAAACGQWARVLGTVWLPAGLAACLGAVGIGIVILFPRAARRLGLGWAERTLLAVACVAAGGAAGASTIGWDAPGWAVPACVLGGVLAGVIAVCRRPPTLLSTAVWIDRQGDLGERMVTAAELASRLKEGSPWARHVWREAAEGFARAGMGRQPPWRTIRTSLAVGALAGVACLAGVLSGPPRTEPTPTRLTDLSRAELDRIADELRRQAMRKERGSALHRRLVRAADLARAGEVRPLEELLAELSRRGVDVTALSLREIDRDPRGQAEEGELAGATTARRGEPPAARTHAAPIDADTQEQRVGRVGIHAPGASDLPTLPKEIRRDAESDGPVAPADSWTHARRRAGDALARGNLPPEYHRLVRAFFQVDVE